MARYERNTGVLLKLETTPGTDAVPDSATDAMLVQNFKCKPVDGKYVNRALLRPYFGGSEDILAESWVSGSFDVELAGSGAAGTAPMWGRLLRAAAFAEVITVGQRVDYTPISTALEAASMYYYDDGVLKRALGLRADITAFKLTYGELPKLSVNFLALDGGDTAVATPGVTLTPWKPPVPVNVGNTGLLTLGCTYAAGALAGGTTVKSRGIELALGGKLAYFGLLGGEEIDFTDRDVTGKIMLDLTAAQEVAKIAEVKAATLQGIGLRHGSVDGYKVLTHLPAAQLKNPSKEAINGRRLIGYDLKAVPVSGNDDWRIVAL